MSRNNITRIVETTIKEFRSSKSVLKEMDFVEPFNLIKLAYMGALTIPIINILGKAFIDYATAHLNREKPLNNKEWVSTGNVQKMTYKITDPLGKNKKVEVANLKEYIYTPENKRYWLYIYDNVNEKISGKPLAKDVVVFTDEDLVNARESVKSQISRKVYTNKYDFPL